MKKDKRTIRQEKLAKLFYEMGMDVELVSKISGVEAWKIVKEKDIKKAQENIVND